MLISELITSLPALAAVEAEWDGLAIVCALPLMAPALILAWWRHLAPPGAQPRAVVVRDGDQLVGLAPFFVEPDARRGRVDYRLPGIEVRLAPLAVPGREWEVAAAIGRELASARPLPDVIALDRANQGVGDSVLRYEIGGAISSRCSLRGAAPW